MLGALRKLTAMALSLLFTNIVVDAYQFDPQSTGQLTGFQSVTAKVMSNSLTLQIQ
jgi:hypothetical protein